MSAMDTKVVQELKAIEMASPDQLREIIQGLPSMLGRKIDPYSGTLSVKMVSMGSVDEEFFKLDPVAAFRMLIKNVEEMVNNEITTQRYILAELYRMRLTWETQNERPKNL